jgi:hypothetical protein
MAAPEARAAERLATTEPALATAGAAEYAEVGVHAQTGGVILDDASNASASARRNRVVLDDHIVAPGQWKDGKILLSRTALREVAAETGEPIRRVLYDTAYHERVYEKPSEAARRVLGEHPTTLRSQASRTPFESFHGLVEPIARVVSRWFGVDDIYEASQDAML